MVETHAPCVFCEIVAGTAPATVVRRWPDALAIVPCDPVTEGHLLVIPKMHVRDALEVPVVTGVVFQRAAEIAPHPCNLITSAGWEATQSVYHLHAHVVPRRVDDGLALPWWSGRHTRAGGRRQSLAGLTAGLVLVFASFLVAMVVGPKVDHPLIAGTAGLVLYAAGAWLTLRYLRQRARRLESPDGDHG